VWDRLIVNGGKEGEKEIGWEGENGCYMNVFMCPFINIQYLNQLDACHIVWHPMQA
jgi:hypothetical protein